MSAAPQLVALLITPEQRARLVSLLERVSSAPGGTCVGELRAAPGPGSRIRWAQAEAQLLAAILDGAA